MPWLMAIFASTARGPGVADASVMPSIVSGPTKAPSYMIGGRAAELIRAHVRNEITMTFTIDIHHHILPDVFWRATNDAHNPSAAS